MNNSVCRRFLLKISLVLSIVSIGTFSLRADEIKFAHFDRPSKDSVIKILAIGNSFSEDAVEQYLYGLAKAGGYKVIIGNLYIGGAPLELHLKNAQEDKDVYEYRKVGVDGKKDRYPKTSISKTRGPVRTPLRLNLTAWEFIRARVYPHTETRSPLLPPSPPGRCLSGVSLLSFISHTHTNPPPRGGLRWTLRRR